MRIVFAGTPEFARVALAQLHAAGLEIALVLTQPDRPAGRGLQPQASPVKVWALAHQLPVAQPRSLRLDGKYPDDAAAGHAAIVAAGPQAMVVAAYGLLLPPSVLALMDGPQQWGCLNIHASLLPRWRGAAPIHRAIEAGDAQTGISIMHMDAGLDTGPVLRTQALAIAPHDTTSTLHDKLAVMGGTLMVDVLQNGLTNGLQAAPQPAEGVCYAHKLAKSEAMLDWHQPVQVLERRIRAFQPFPVASTLLDSAVIKIWACLFLPDVPRPPDAVCGQVVAVSAAGVDVAALDGLLRLTHLQKAGGKPLAAADFLRGFSIPLGAVLGAPVLPGAGTVRA